MNSTSPLGQKQTGNLTQGRMASTMPADMRGSKRAPTATTSKAIGKSIFTYFAYYLIPGLTDEMMAMIGEDEKLHYLLKLHHFI
jgi:hypothetical protein